MTAHYRLRPDVIGKEIKSQDFKYWWLAEMLSIHKSTLRRWLNGEIQIVRAKNARRLAELLNLPVEKIGEPVVLTRTSHWFHASEIAIERRA